MISGFLKWLLRDFAIIVLASALMGLSGVISMIVSQPVIDAFTLNETAGLLVQLGCFLILLVACGWAYDSFKEWQFSRKKD